MRCTIHTWWRSIVTIGLLAISMGSVLASDRSSSCQLKQIIEQHWQYKLRENPILSSRMGEQDNNHRLPGVTEKDRARRLAAEQQFVERLQSIDEQQLNEADQVNRQVLLWVLHNSIESNLLFADRVPLNTFESFWSKAAEASHGIAMRTVADYQDYIHRLADFGRYFDENIANMRQGIADGFVLPKIVIQGIAPTVQAQVFDDAESSTLYAPFLAMPTHFSKVDKKNLQQQARLTLNEVVKPAYQRLAKFLSDEYLQAASESIGVSQVAGGKEYYRHTIRTYVTLDMSPEEIHQIGLQEVKRIRQEMDKIIRDLDFKGSFEEFTQFLRTDSRFYPETADELLREAAYIAKRIDYRLPEFFATLPRMPYGVVAVPDAIAPNYTTASYNGAAIGGTRGGAYWVNTYALDQRPLYEMVALTLHEAVPGHHLQTAISQELENVPDFRRELYLSAYGEGWGLYAEKLGVEMGVYDTPYQQFGRLSYEMWRACRLVIDTGIHAMGWTRQQALDYLSDNTSLSLANVRAEVDRYISWPGQALSYKMGEITISRLRAKAEQDLGINFDIRTFHDALLSNGALPLNILEQRIAGYIKENKQ